MHFLIHRHFKSLHRYSAFTLIELLVATAIIALLAAILFPVFGRVRENARRSSCASNQKQIGLAVIQYAQDYDELYPCGTYAYEGFANNGAGWAVQTYPYIKSYEVYKCASESAKDVNISYAGNSNFFGLNRKLSSFNSPSRTVAVTELTAFPYKLTDTYKYNQCPSWNGLAYKFRADVYNNQWGGGGWKTVTGWLAGYTSGDELGRHPEGSNILFADGHVKWLLGKQVSPGQNASTSTSNQVNGDYGNAAGTDVMTYAATFSAK